ncbi:MAG: hypothetical protein ABSG94_02615, partial [Brevinematales bacterium]
RSAREGDLTITGPLGNVIGEAVYDKNNGAGVLKAEFTAGRLHTLYSEYGGWFCWMILTVLVILVFYPAVRRFKNRSVKKHGH